MLTEYLHVPDTGADDSRIAVRDIAEVLQSVGLSD